MFVNAATESFLVVPPSLIERIVFAREYFNVPPELKLHLLERPREMRTGETRDKQDVVKCT